MNLAIGCTTRPHASISFSDACERIAAAGYREVAVFRNQGEAAVNSESSPDEVAEARRIAADAGLRPSMLLGRTRLELGLGTAVRDYLRLISNASELGSTWLLDCGTGDEAHFADYYELMRRVMPHAQDCGIGVVLKPHGGITLTVEDLLKAEESVGHPSFGICYDPGNIIYYSRGELRPEVGIERIAPAVRAFIVKDCILRDGTPDVMVTPGEGLVDFERVLSGLVQGGFDGPLYVECVGGDDVKEVDENLRRTLGFLEDILASL
jgi:sugar phosphate isomerase/epimerase